MYRDDWDINNKLTFWFDEPAMYFVPNLPPNLEAAVIRVIRQEAQRAEQEAAFYRRLRRPWWRRWLH
jgi:hypothetical protein